MRLKEEHVRYVLDELAEFDAARDPGTLSQVGLRDAVFADASPGLPGAQ